MSVATLIEVAEANDRYVDGVLIVLDGLAADRFYGVQVELERTTGVPGWRCLTRDGVGHASSVWVPDSHGREAAVERSLNGYLDLINGGRHN